MFGSSLRQTRRNDAFPSQASATLTARVRNLFELRSETTGAKIGSYPISKLNVSIPIHYTGLAFKSQHGNDLPTVFASLTGLSQDNRTARERQTQMYCVGRLCASVNFEGMSNDAVGVQCGGSATMRLFNAVPGERYSPGDYITWELPNYSDQKTFAEQMSALSQVDPDDLPKGMIPVLHRTVNQTGARDFAIDCMEMFAKNENQYLDSNGAFPFIRKDKLDQNDRMNNFIIYGIIIPCASAILATSSNKDYANLRKLIYGMNAGLCLKPQSSTMLGTFGYAADNLKKLRDYSTRHVGANFDAFMDQWSRVVGKVISPGGSGDLVNVLLRP
jgi:hypothetical protein